MELQDARFVSVYVNNMTILTKKILGNRTMRDGHHPHAFSIRM